MPVREIQKAAVKPDKPNGAVNRTKMPLGCRGVARNFDLADHRDGVFQFPPPSTDLANFIPSISLERSKSVPPTARLFKKENTFRDTVGYQLRTYGSQENERTTTKSNFEFGGLG
jgi:hypothetical protein